MVELRLGGVHHRACPYPKGDPTACRCQHWSGIASFDREIPVTPEMLAAAHEVDDDDRYVGQEHFTEIYRAMHAHAPGPYTTATVQADMRMTERNAQLLEELREARDKIIRLHNELHRASAPVPVYLRTDNVDYALGCISPEAASQLARALPENLQREAAEARDWQKQALAPDMWKREHDICVQQRDAALAAYDACGKTIGKVMAERDAARMCVTSLENRVKELESYSHGLAAEHDRLTLETASRFSTAEVNALLAARDARIAELDTMLAQRPAPVPVTPAPGHDPFREHETDRRRIGG